MISDKLPNQLKGQDRWNYIIARRIILKKMKDNDKLNENYKGQKSRWNVDETIAKELGMSSKQYMHLWIHRNRKKYENVTSNKKESIIPGVIVSGINVQSNINDRGAKFTEFKRDGQKFITAQSGNFVKLSTSDGTSDNSLPGQIIRDSGGQPNYPYSPTAPTPLPTLPQPFEWPQQNWNLFPMDSKIPTFNEFIKKLNEIYKINPSLPYADMVLERCDGMNGFKKRDKATVQAVFHLLKVLFP